MASAASSAASPAQPTTTTVDLVRQIASSSVSIPIVAAGAIMTADHVSEVLSAGAQCAQLGTRFLACAESAAPAFHKEAVLTIPHETTLTSTFTGRKARSIINRFVKHMEHQVQSEGLQLLPWGMQRAATADISSAARQHADGSNFYPLFCGTGIFPSGVAQKNAAEIVQELVS
jgi:nitronate monooxygenase